MFSADRGIDVLLFLSVKCFNEADHFKQSHFWSHMYRKGGFGKCHIFSNSLSVFVLCNPPEGHK